MQSDAPIDIVLGARTGHAGLSAGGRPFDHTGGYVTATLDPPAGSEPEALARILADPAHACCGQRASCAAPAARWPRSRPSASRWTVSDAPADAPAGLICIGLEGQSDLAAIRRAVSDCCAKR